MGGRLSELDVGPARLFSRNCLLFYYKNKVGWLFLGLIVRADEIRSDVEIQRPLQIFSAMGVYYIRKHIEILAIDNLNPNGVRLASENAIQALPSNMKSVEDICGVCLASMKITTMPCSHQYHAECISGWLKNSNSCPHCRTSLPGPQMGRGTDPSESDTVYEMEEQ